MQQVASALSPGGTTVTTATNLSSVSTTSSATRLLHEQLRGEIALLQLEVNQLATANAELRRTSVTATSDMDNVRNNEVVAVDVCVGPDESASVQCPAEHSSLLPRRSYEMTGLPSPVGNDSTAGGVAIRGVSAAQLCPVVVAGDDDASYRYCEVGTDAYGTSVILHRSTPPTAPRTVGVDAATDTGNERLLPHSAFVDVDRVIAVAEELHAAAGMLGSAERILVRDSTTACDVAEAETDAPLDPALVRGAPSAAVAGEVAFDRLRHLASHLVDRATEVRDTALARQVALTTYLDRSSLERTHAAIESQERIAKAEGDATEARTKAASMEEELRRAVATLSALEQRNIALFKAAETVTADAERSAQRVEELEVATSHLTGVLTAAREAFQAADAERAEQKVRIATLEEEVAVYRQRELDLLRAAATTEVDHHASAPPPAIQLDGRDAVGSFATGPFVRASLSPDAHFRPSLGATSDGTNAAAYHRREGAAAGSDSRACSPEDDEEQPMAVGQFTPVRKQQVTTTAAARRGSNDSGVAAFINHNRKPLKSPSPHDDDDDADADVVPTTHHHEGEDDDADEPFFPDVWRMEPAVPETVDEVASAAINNLTREVLRRQRHIVTTGHHNYN